MRKTITTTLLILLTMANAYAGDPSQEHFGLLKDEFQSKVSKSLQLPYADGLLYARLASEQLSKNNIVINRPQMIAVADRNPLVQSVMLYGISIGETGKQSWTLIGSAPVATGQPGRVDHYFTPVGVFPHTPVHHDYRAEGTRNSKGIRGYGSKGMRVYDLGWQSAVKAWGKPEDRTIRMQIHATDPDILEPRLGKPGSKGCLRIPGTLNTFMDQHGILDYEYINSGNKFWKAGHLVEKTTELMKNSHLLAGTYLVIVDSERNSKPEWQTFPVK